MTPKHISTPNLASLWLAGLLPLIFLNELLTFYYEIFLKSWYLCFLFYLISLFPIERVENRRGNTSVRANIFFFLIVFFFHSRKT